MRRSTVGDGELGAVLAPDWCVAGIATGVIVLTTFNKGAVVTYPGGAELKVAATAAVWRAPALWCAATCAYPARTVRHGQRIRNDAAVLK